MSEKTVLIVDDDATFRQALAGSLRRRGFKVLVAGSVEEGISEAEAWKPDYATVDLVMPGGGLALVEALVQSWPDMRVVVLTGFGSIATAVRAVKLGAVQYLTKPATAAQICAAFLDEEPPEEPAASAEPQNLSLDVLEWEHLQRVLDETGGNVSEAARRLDMHRRTLQRKLRRGAPHEGDRPLSEGGARSK
jgi:two-component system response regulator RegA